MERDVGPGWLGLTYLAEKECSAAAFQANGGLDEAACAAVLLLPSARWRETAGHTNTQQLLSCLPTHSPLLPCREEGHNGGIYHEGAPDCPWGRQWAFWKGEVGRSRGQGKLAQLGGTGRSVPAAAPCVPHTVPTGVLLCRAPSLVIVPATLLSAAA